VRVCRPSHVFWGIVDAETIVCDARNGELFTLNATAGLLWNFCDGRSAESLVTHLTATFPDHDTKILAADVASFVESMRDRGLLKADGER
jgi:hypothetical protein